MDLEATVRGQIRHLPGQQDVLAEMRTVHLSNTSVGRCRWVVPLLSSVFLVHALVSSLEGFRLKFCMYFSYL
jgi:hypothetical protein